MWNYIYYISYILEKNKNELSGEESFVYEKFLKDNPSWLPYKECKAVRDFD